MRGVTVLRVRRLPREVEPDERVQLAACDKHSGRLPLVYARNGADHRGTNNHLLRQHGLASLSG